MDIIFLEKFGHYKYIKNPCQMAQNYIETHHERDKNKSKVLSSFGQRSQYVLSRILYSQKLQEKTHNLKEKTNLFMDTLLAFQVPLGMRTPKTNLN
jgi:hypothetical protein